MTWLALAALALVAPAWADDTAARFHRIYEQEWAWRNGQAGINNAGEAQPSNARLDDVDAASQQRRLEMWKKTLADLDAIDPKQLGAEDKINYAVYRTQIQNMLAGQQYKQWQMPFNSDSAFWSDLGYVLNADELRTPQDYRRYLDRLGQVPAYFDQQIANMRDGLDRGFTVPRAVLDGRDVSIAAVAELKDPTKWQGPYLDKTQLPVDPWNNPYQYEPLGTDQFRIWSSGPDGATGTEDDISTAL